MVAPGRASHTTYSTSEGDPPTPTDTHPRLREWLRATLDEHSAGRMARCSALGARWGRGWVDLLGALRAVNHVCRADDEYMGIWMGRE